MDFEVGQSHASILLTCQIPCNFVFYIAIKALAGLTLMRNVYLIVVVSGVNLTSEFDSEVY